VARGLPVVSPAWIAESRKAGLFLDPWSFLLRDEANEKKLGFKLEATLHQVSGHIYGQRESKPGLVIIVLVFSFQGMAGFFSHFKGLLVVFYFKGWLVVFLISKDNWLFFSFQGMAGCFLLWLVVFPISMDSWLFFSFQGMAGCFSHFKE
jgi:hypothetical protein